MRAGLTQAELSKRTGRDRSVIARWEQGFVSPPVERLLACVQACGFDLPLALVPVDTSADDEIREQQLLPPSDRVQHMLERLDRIERG